MGVQIPSWEGAFLREEMSVPLQSIGTLCSPCVKTAEPIEMPFGLLAGMGRRNHVLDGGPVVLRDVAMATNY